MTTSRLCRIAVLAGFGLALAATTVQAQLLLPPPQATASVEDDLSDAEPVDPAEYRPQTQPPQRPQQRGGATWTELGPAPTRSAQVVVPPDNLVCGAVQAIAPHPTNANLLYIGAVNGGIWRTNNATAANPSWTPLTDDLPSQSIGALALDPNDLTGNTVIAGTGRWSNFAQRGDDEIGVYRTTNAGASWSVLGGTTFLGQKISGVAARGTTLLAASFNGGLYRSLNTGAAWTLISGNGTSGLPAGGIGDLASDPTDESRFYLSVFGTSGMYRSTNNGGVWTSINTGITGLAANSRIRIAVGPTGVLFLAITNGGTLARVYRSANQGDTWTALDVPAVHPGIQGQVNTSVAVDPNNSNVVYIGGDRITSGPFTGNLVRGNATLAAGTQFTSIVDGNAGNTAPHADSRALAFDANDNLLEASDGGIYRRTNPTSSAGVWTSVIGNLNVMEVHDLDHDSVSNIIVIGTQDNGTHMQQTAANPVWTLINGGDGGDVAIDDVTQGVANSYRFISSQNLGGFRRARYSAANAFVNNTAMPGGVTDPQFVTPLEINVGSSNRMLIGGLNTLYEILDFTVAAPVLSTIGAPGANRNAMAYGAVGNPGVAYVGKGIAVHRRNGAGFVATTALPAGAATVTDVALNPTNPNVVFAIDDNQVFRSTDAGTTWQDVTGNLLSISGADFRTIEYVPHSGGAVMAVGTRSGVFTALITSSNWTQLGTGLPDVLVFDLRYVAGQNRLIAGTLGRGVWSMDVSDLDVIFRDGFQLP